MSARLSRWALGLILPAALLVLWWYASDGSSSVYFPALRDILTTFHETWIFDRFGRDLVPTVRNFVVGFAIAAGAGVAGGIALGMSDRARRDLSPVTEYFRAIPIVALVPVAVILLDSGATMEIAVIAFGSWWPILLSTTDAVRGLDPQLLETAKVYGMSPTTRLLRVVLPASLPRIFPGVRIALAIGITAMLVANMYASSRGLGFYVVDRQSTFDVKGTWSGALAIGLVGALANLIVLAMESRALAWHRGWRTIDKENSQ